MCNVDFFFISLYIAQTLHECVLLPVIKVASYTMLTGVATVVSMCVWGELKLGRTVGENVLYCSFLRARKRTR